MHSHAAPGEEDRKHDSDHDDWHAKEKNEKDPALGRCFLGSRVALDAGGWLSLGRGVGLVVTPAVVNRGVMGIVVEVVADVSPVLSSARDKAVLGARMLVTEVTLAAARSTRGVEEALADLVLLAVLEVALRLMMFFLSFDHVDGNHRWGLLHWHAHRLLHRHAHRLLHRHSHRLLHRHAHRLLHGHSHGLLHRHAHRLLCAGVGLHHRLVVNWLVAGLHSVRLHTLFYFILVFYQRRADA